MFPRDIRFLAIVGQGGLEPPPRGVTARRPALGSARWFFPMKMEPLCGASGENRTPIPGLEARDLQPLDDARLGGGERVTGKGLEPLSPELQSGAFRVKLSRQRLLARVELVGLEPTTAAL